MFTNKQIALLCASIIYAGQCIFNGYTGSKDPIERAKPFEDFLEGNLKSSESEHEQPHS